jgi:hypothetical protein
LGEAGSVSKRNATEVIPPDLQAWIETRKRRRLSHAHVQMARELGLNPKKLGKLDNHRRQPWKAPLPEFIEDLYLKRFGRSRPETVVPIEELARRKATKRATRKAERRVATAVARPELDSGEPFGE